MVKVQNSNKKYISKMINPITLVQCPVACMCLCSLASPLRCNNKFVEGSYEQLDRTQQISQVLKGQFELNNWKSGCATGDTPFKFTFTLVNPNGLQDLVLRAVFSACHRKPMNLLMRSRQVCYLEVPQPQRLAPGRGLWSKADHIYRCPSRQELC